MGHWWDPSLHSPVTDWSVPVPTAGSQQGCCHTRSFLPKPVGFSFPCRATGDLLASFCLGDQHMLLLWHHCHSPLLGLTAVTQEERVSRHPCLHAGLPCHIRWADAVCQGWGPRQCLLPERGPRKEVQHLLKPQNRTLREHKVCYCCGSGTEQR